MNKEAFDKIKRQIKGKEFKLICGHNNGYQIPLYPFEWVCIECGMRTSESNLIKVI